MKKFALAFAAIIGALLIGLFILSLTLDTTVKSNIEEIASELLGTEVTVRDVSLSVWDGTGKISDISISNPDAFSEEPAIRFESIDIDMELSSLLSDTILVNEIRIQRPELFVEQRSSGNNLNALLDQLSRGDTDQESNLIIDYLLIENGEVTLMADLGEESSTKSELPTIELEGIGRDSNNTAEDALREILEPILREAIQRAARDGLMDQTQDQLENLLDS